MYVIQPCHGLYLATREQRVKGKVKTLPACYPGNRAKIMYRKKGEHGSGNGHFLAVINPTDVEEQIIHTGNRVLTGKGVHWTGDISKAYRFKDKRSAMLYTRRELVFCDPCEREYMIMDLAIYDPALRLQQMPVCTDPTADARTSPNKERTKDLHLIPVSSKGIGRLPLRS